MPSSWVRFSVIPSGVKPEAQSVARELGDDGGRECSADSLSARFSSRRATTWASICSEYAFSCASLAMAASLQVLNSLSTCSFQARASRSTADERACLVSASVLRTLKISFTLDSICSEFFCSHEAYPSFSSLCSSLHLGFGCPWLLGLSRRWSSIKLIAISLIHRNSRVLRSSFSFSVAAVPSPAFVIELLIWMGFAAITPFSDVSPYTAPKVVGGTCPTKATSSGLRKKLKPGEARKGRPRRSL